MTYAEKIAADAAAYLKSVAENQGYDVAAILRKRAAYNRTKKASRYHEIAAALEVEAAKI